MAAINVAMSTSIANSFSGLKKMDSMPGSLQQAMAVELKGTMKVQKSRASRGQRVRVAGVRSMAPELAEMEPASQGSQLLGDISCPFITCELASFRRIVTGCYYEIYVCVLRHSL